MPFILLSLWSAVIWALHCLMMVVLIPFFLSVLKSLISKGEKSFFTPLGYHWAYFLGILFNRSRQGIAVSREIFLNSGALICSVTAFTLIPSFSTNMISAGASSLVIIFTFLIGAVIFHSTALLTKPFAQAYFLGQKNLRAIVYATPLLMIWLLCIWMNMGSFSLDQIIIETKKAGLGSDIWGVQILLGGVLMCMAPVFCYPLRVNTHGRYQSSLFFNGTEQAVRIASEGVLCLVWVTLIWDIIFPFALVSSHPDKLFSSIVLTGVALPAYILRLLLSCGLIAIATICRSMWRGRDGVYTHFALFLLGITFLLVWLR